MNSDNKCQQTWLAGMQGGSTDTMEYQQDMFTYALHGDGTAHDNQSPLSNTSISHDHCITQDTGYSSTISGLFSSEADNQTNTGIDIHATHNVPQSRYTDMLSASTHPIIMSYCVVQVLKQHNLLFLFPFKQTR